MYFWNQVLFFVYSVWRSVTRETISPCAQCVTEPAATGNWSQLAARLGPATCSTMRPPSSSPSLCHYGVSSSVLLSCLPHALLLLYTNCCVSTYWGQTRSDKCWRDLCPGFTLLFNSSHIHPCLNAELLKKLIILAKALNLPFLFWSPTVTGFEIKNNTLWQSYLLTSVLFKWIKISFFEVNQKVNRVEIKPSYFCIHTAELESGLRSLFVSLWLWSVLNLLSSHTDLKWTVSEQFLR